MKTVILCGMGRSGKDTGCEILASLTGLRNAGTCSVYLCDYVAAALGQSKEQAYAERHLKREIWRALGDEMRRDDPAIIIRTMLQHGEIGGGPRGLAEVEAARAEGLGDLWVWVDRDVPVDPTVEYGPGHCDIVIENKGTLDEYAAKLRRLAAFAGLLKG